MTNDSPAPQPVVTDDDPATLVSRVEGRLDELATRFDKTDWVELLAATILALATIIAAWSAYQSTRWSGEQAKAANQALALRTEAAEATTVYAEGVEVDSEFLATWLIMAAESNTRGMVVLEDRLRPEFRPAFDSWLASAPAGEIPPGTPFDLAEYDASAGVARAEARQLNLDADAATAKAGDANQTGDNFVLVAVIMASVLFFAGVGTKFRGRRVRVAMILGALVLFAGGLLFMLSLPPNVGLG